MSPDPIKMVRSVIKEIGKDETMTCSSVFAHLLQETKKQLSKSVSDGPDSFGTRVMTTLERQFHQTKFEDSSETFGKDSDDVDCLPMKDHTGDFISMSESDVTMVIKAIIESANSVKKSLARSQERNWLGISSIYC